MCEDASGNWFDRKDVPGEFGIMQKDNKPCHKLIAKLHYMNDINQTGQIKNKLLSFKLNLSWAYLEMNIKKDSIEFWKQGYAAGYLEGWKIY